MSLKTDEPQCWAAQPLQEALCFFLSSFWEGGERNLQNRPPRLRLGVAISGRSVLASEENHHQLPRTYSIIGQSGRPGTGRNQMAPSKVGKIVHKGMETDRKQELNEKGIKLPESKSGGIRDGKILGLERTQSQNHGQQAWDFKGTADPSSSSSGPAGIPQISKSTKGHRTWRKTLLGFSEQEQHGEKGGTSDCFSPFFILCKSTYLWSWIRMA